MKDKPPRTLLVALYFAFLPLSLSANQETAPPLDRESLVGTWEALVFPPPSDLLFHMQINATGDSYLVEAWRPGPRAGYLVRRLLSAEIKNGAVRLHFGKPLKGESGAIPDVWIVGKGNFTIIEGWFNFCKDCPPPGFPSSSDGPPMLKGPGTVTLIKGPWTQALGEASRIAEERIRDVTGADAATGIEGAIAVEIVQGGSSSQGPAANSTFIVENGKQTVASFTTDKEGRFRAWLKPGHYTVSTIGDSGGANSCGPFEADVAAGQMTKVKWCCEIEMK